jgi:molybdopterin-guanine dinucleotide biosynthesis protein A
MSNALQTVYGPQVTDIVISYEMRLTGEVVHICAKHDHSRYSARTARMVRNAHDGKCTVCPMRAVRA